MSDSHTIAEISYHRIPFSFRTLVELAALLGATMQGRATRIAAAVNQRFMQRRLSRHSDHMLHDLGFERDWDGAIRSLRDAD